MEQGAKGDGISDDTAVFNKVIAELSSKGGGTMLIPKGDYIVGTVFLCSNLCVNIHSGANLIGSKDEDLFAELEELEVYSLKKHGDGSCRRAGSPPIAA